MGKQLRLNQAPGKGLDRLRNSACKAKWAGANKSKRDVACKAALQEQGRRETARQWVGFPWLCQGATEWLRYKLLPLIATGDQDRPMGMGGIAWAKHSPEGAARGSESGKPRFWTRACPRRSPLRGCSSVAVQSPPASRRFHPTFISHKKLAEGVGFGRW